MSLLAAHQGPGFAPDIPPATAPSKEPKKYSKLASAASIRARERHHKLATHYTAGRCAAWDDVPCGLLPAIYRPHTEAATEWIKGFNEGYAERMSLEAQP